MDVSQLGRNFRENLESALKEKGWNQSDLARAMDITPTQVYKYLRGHSTPGLDQVERFAKALDLDALDLLGEPIGAK
jgi:transcriptional regulator with XRE-family HTH domain